MRNSHESVKPLHLNRRGLVGNRQSNTMLNSGGDPAANCHQLLRWQSRSLFLQRQTRALAVTERIGLKQQVDALSCILEIEVARSALPS